MSELFHPSDEYYFCAENGCNKKLRFSSWLNSVCEIGEDGRLVSQDHTCHSTITKKRNVANDMGISSMQSERQAQYETYGKFTSSRQLGLKTTRRRQQDLRQQPMTQEHKDN